MFFVKIKIEQTFPRYSFKYEYNKQLDSEIIITVAADWVNSSIYNLGL